MSMTTTNAVTNAPQAPHARPAPAGGARAFAEGYGSVACIFASPPPGRFRGIRRRASLDAAAADTLGDFAAAHRRLSRAMKPATDAAGQ